MTNFKTTVNFLKEYQMRKNKTLADLASGLDNSFKGSVDFQIRNFVQIVNQSDFFFTLSSCSGRITITTKPFDGSKIDTNFYLNSHEKVKINEILDLIEKFCKKSLKNPLNKKEKPLKNDKTDEILSIRYEPAILAAESNDLQKANEFVNAAKQCGFKESGLDLKFTKNLKFSKKVSSNLKFSQNLNFCKKILIIIRSSRVFEMPLAVKFKNGENCENDEKDENGENGENDKKDENGENGENNEIFSKIYLKKYENSSKEKNMKNLKNDAINENFEHSALSLILKNLNFMMEKNHKNLNLLRDLFVEKFCK